MKPSIRLAYCLGALLLAAGAISCPYVRKVVRMADDDPDPVGSLRELRSARHRSAELEDRRERILLWQERKREVARELVAGRMTLREAAARFRELDEQLPDFRWELFRQAFPGCSDEERHCRHVIAFVEAELCKSPSEAAEVVPLLEAQLQGYRECDGTRHLPEPPR